MKIQGDGTKRFIDLLTSAQRKEFPMCTGLVDYAPDALAAIAHISYVGDRKHNPGKLEGEPPHHARGKSMDHPDCVVRHMSTRRDVDPAYADDIIAEVFHRAEAAWRAIMDLQETMERVYALPLAPAARVDPPQAQADDIPERNARAIVALIADHGDEHCTTAGCVLKPHDGSHVDADVAEQARDIVDMNPAPVRVEGYPAGRCPMCRAQPCACAAALANMPPMPATHEGCMLCDGSGSKQIMIGSNTRTVPCTGPLLAEPGMTRAPVGSGAMVLQPEDFDAAD